VTEVDDDIGCLVVGGMTYGKGTHVLWNYEDVKDYPDFQRYVEEGKIKVLN
jgi:hypothetical protein